MVSAATTSHCNLNMLLLHLIFHIYFIHKTSWNLEASQFGMYALLCSDNRFCWARDRWPDWIIFSCFKFIYHLLGLAMDLTKKLIVGENVGNKCSKIQCPKYFFVSIEISIYSSDQIKVRTSWLKGKFESLCIALPKFPRVQVTHDQNHWFRNRNQTTEVQEFWRWHVPKLEFGYEVGLLFIGYRQQFWEA